MAFFFLLHPQMSPRSDAYHSQLILHRTQKGLSQESFSALLKHNGTSKKCVLFKIITAVNSPTSLAEVFDN